MNYIIFGGTGFIGTHLANYLHESHPMDSIWNLDIIDPAKLDSMTDERCIREYTTIKKWKTPLVNGSSRKSTFIYCDVREPIEKIPFIPTEGDVIFNLAAVHRTPGHPDYAYFETNIKGAENVCAFARKYGIKKILFTSSIAPYGAAEQLKKESTLPTPNTPYGISKLVAEKIHMNWLEGTEDGKLTILRPGVVFGKGENGNFTRLYWGIKKHTFMFPGRKDTIKACIYVKELVRFMLWNVEKRRTRLEIFNCTYEPAFTIESIVKEMKKVTGLSSYIPFVPNFIIMPAAYCSQLIGSPMGVCPARVRKLQISTNISGLKMATCGYVFNWKFDDAIADWFVDNEEKYLQ